MADDLREVLYAEQLLDALPDEASSSDTFRALHGNNPEVTAAVAVRRAMEGGGGGSTPISSISAEASEGTIVLPQTTFSYVDVDGLTVDAQYGDAVTLGVDAKTFTLEAGAYQIQASVFLGGGVGTTGVRISGSDLTADGSSFNSGRLAPGPSDSVYASGLFMVTVETELFFKVQASGGTDPDSLSFFGVDIARLGDVAAAP